MPKVRREAAAVATLGFARRRRSSALVIEALQVLCHEALAQSLVFFGAAAQLVFGGGSALLCSFGALSQCLQIGVGLNPEGGAVFGEAARGFRH